MSEVLKNDRAWATIFAEHQVLQKIEEHGLFEITATAINQHREARLMTKFDHKANLPRLFVDNHLTILPVTRGKYVISHFDAYKEFPENSSEIIRASLPTCIQSIDYKNITSESIALNCAYVASILADFLEEENLFPTVSGRMSAGSFSFRIMNQATKKPVKLEVSNAQLEIDGGYEGNRQLAIIEAKNFISEDFLIRQLYYPFRLWRGKLTKKVTPVFLIYSNGIFTLYEYEFQDPEDYNSLLLVKHKNYSVEPLEITLDDIVNLLQRIKITRELPVPFPQADSFRRVINLCELLDEGELSKDDITLNYAFDPRQTNYYTDAGRYLGLIQKRTEEGKIVFSLTSEGQRIMRAKFKARQLLLVETILKHKAFNDVLHCYLNLQDMPSKNDVVNIMKQADLYHIKSELTFQRRASTITGWINWILDLQR